MTRDSIWTDSCREEELLHMSWRMYISRRHVYMKSRKHSFIPRSQSFEQDPRLPSLVRLQATDQGKESDHPRCLALPHSFPLTSHHSSQCTFPPSHHMFRKTLLRPNTLKTVLQASTPRLRPALTAISPAQTRKMTEIKKISTPLAAQRKSGHDLPHIPPATQC